MRSGDMEVSRFLVLTSLVALLGGVAFGQVTPTPLLEYDSAGGTGSLPDASWTLNDPDGAGTVLESYLDSTEGGLRFNDADATTDFTLHDVYYEHAGLPADATSGYTVLIRARRLTDPAAQRGGAIFMYNSTTPDGFQGLQLGRLTADLRTNRLYSARNEANLTEAYDLSQWHTFRFVMKDGGIPGYGGNNLGVFVDENPDQYYSTGTSVQDGPASYFRLGLIARTRAVAQQVVIDWVKVFGEVVALPTNTPPPPTITPTAVVCNFGLIECGFERGSLAPYWLACSAGPGAADDVQNGATFFGNTGAYEGTYIWGSGASYSTKDGQIYQTVDVPAGTYYATAWAHNGNDTDASNVSRVGLEAGTLTDPTGACQWSSWESAQTAWTQMTTPNVTVTSPITVFLEIDQLWGLEWNINRIDWVELHLVPATEAWPLY